MKDSKSKQATKPSMLSIAGDLPNICSLAGLFCAILGIYFAILGHFSYAIIGVIWAVLFDWTDGIVARRMKGRTARQGLIGEQLDTLIDIVSFGVFPAFFLLSYGKFNPWFLPGAFLLVASSAVRLSYFNVFGLVDKKTYMGLALDNNVIILSFIYLVEGFFSESTFSIILYALLMIMMVFNLAPIRTPKFVGKWFYVLIAYTLVLTGLYGVILSK
jgi:archaetidylserine synthase